MPLLPLEIFRRELSYNPFHFFGLATSTGRGRVTSSCNQVLSEYAWQDADGIGREEIRHAIETAEDRLKQYLGYAVAPRYAVQTLAYPGAGDAWGRWSSIPLNDGYVQSIGVETRSLIQAGVAVAYTNLGTGRDTATISVATTVTDPDQILVFFATADRYDGTAIPATGDLGGDAERFLIEPLRVSISSGTATITGPAWLFVEPVQYQGVSDDNTLSATDTTIYASTVDIYRRYVNPDGTTTDTSQATLVWETTPCGGWWCCGSDGVTWADSSTDPAALGYAIARAGIRDARLGIVSVGSAAYDSAAATWGEASLGICRAPDRVTVRYRAGLPLVNGQMQRHMQVIVARMAIAEMERPIGACADNAGRTRHRWQTDLAQSSGNNDESYGAVSAADLDNPFGTRRGHVHAWRSVRALRLLPGFLP